MLDAATAAGQPLIEAFHYRYHPVVDRIMSIVSSGVLGLLRQVETRYDLPAQWVSPDNIRHKFALGGGVMMDVGCYCS